MNAIEIHSLSYSYKTDKQEHRVLDSLSLSIAKGELVAIKGSSGSGKSTLLYLLGTLLKPDSGSIKINGIDITKINESQAAQLRANSLGFIFQQFHLIPHFKSIDNILLKSHYPLGTKKSQSTVVNNCLGLLKRVGLKDHAHKKPNQLSGGQQQRVAITRAISSDPEIIFADEPTGSLDSKTSKGIVEILKEINTRGKTVIIITHDQSIADQCGRVISIKDGKIVEDIQSETPVTREVIESNDLKKIKKSPKVSLIKYIYSLCMMSMGGLAQQKTRSALTMIGVIIGIAAVLSMLTLARHTKTTILKSYESLGVNKISVGGNPNWRLEATDIVPVKFDSFNYKSDISPLKKIFPSIELISPILRQWGATAVYGGLELSDAKPIGANQDFFAINNKNLLIGNIFNNYHITNNRNVCVIGFEVANKLFSNTNPIDKIVQLKEGDSNYTCRVIGVMDSQQSNKDWEKLDNQIIMPFTYLATVTDWWNSKIRNFAINLETSTDIEQTGKSIKGYFEKKYGKSGRFHIDQDSVLVAQVKKFLSIFSLLLGAIAFLSLLIGGVGITNMMLASLAERLREIGIRRSLGATPNDIKNQFLFESFILTFIAGILGLILGFFTYELILYLADKATDKLEFVWTFDYFAILVSFVSIFVIGLLSGLIPAMKAKRLEVIDCLRSE